MDGWLGYLIALGVLVILAPLAAWLGRRHGGPFAGPPAWRSSAWASARCSTRPAAT